MCVQRYCESCGALQNKFKLLGPCEKCGSSNVTLEWDEWEVDDKNDDEESNDYTDDDLEEVQGF